jgi:RimJ/RimL family protein N-acetyltransferase
LLPEHRGKGLGKKVHQLGLKELGKLGCSIYFGSTSIENKSMLAVFKSNECMFLEEQKYFNLKI